MKCSTTQKLDFLRDRQSCVPWQEVSKYVVEPDIKQQPYCGNRRLGCRYRIPVVLSRRHFPPNYLKCWNFGHREIGCPSVVFKNRLWQDNAPEAHKAGTLMCLVQPKNPNRRRVNIKKGMRLDLYYPKVKSGICSISFSG